MDNTIDAKWVYALKKDRFGRICKAMARLVAWGFEQRECLNFDEPIASTVSGTNARLFASISCELDLDVCHFEVDQAFYSVKCLAGWFSCVCCRSADDCMVQFCV